MLQSMTTGAFVRNVGKVFSELRYQITFSSLTSYNHNVGDDSLLPSVGSAMEICISVVTRRKVISLSNRPTEYKIA